MKLDQLEAPTFHDDGTATVSAAWLEEAADYMEWLRTAGQCSRCERIIDIDDSESSEDDAICEACLDENWLDVFGDDNMSAHAANATAIWEAWNDLDDDETSPVRTIAQKLGLSTALVAGVVFPPATFGIWNADHEPLSSFLAEPA